jgi:hypothetical protein
MKYYEVKVLIPCTVEKTIYIDDATGKADARRKAKAWGNDEYEAYYFSGDENPDQDYSKLKVLNVKERK